MLDRVKSIQVPIGTHGQERVNTAQHFCFDWWNKAITSSCSPQTVLWLWCLQKGENTMLLVETTTAKTSKNWQNLMSYPTSRACEDLVFCSMQFYHKNCLVSNCQSKAQWILSPQNYITASSSWDKQYIYQLGNTKIKHLLYTILQPHRQVICNNLWNTCLNINTT